MRRTIALAAFAVAAAAPLLPVAPASACDPRQDPRCPSVSVCRTFDYWHDVLTTIFADPVPRPICPEA